MALMVGWDIDIIKKEFLEWWHHSKSEDFRARVDSHMKEWEHKQLVNYSKKEVGSHARVYYECYDNEGKKFAMKMPKFDDAYGRLQLYIEYKIHQKIYDLCGDKNNRFIKPLWIKKVTFNRGFHCPVMAMGLECIDDTFYEYMTNSKDDEQRNQREKQLMKWKGEIITELKRLHLEYTFFHRDCHLSNIAVVGNGWKFFDLGMSRLGDYEPLSGGFYPDGLIPSLSHDERIFRNSFCRVLGLEKDDWLKKEDFKIIKSHAKYWEANTPVVVSGHPQSENGRFQFIDVNEAIVIDLEVEENTKLVEVKSKINPTTRLVKPTSNKVLTCHFKKKNVLPDVFNEYIYYFLPTLN